MKKCLIIDIDGCLANSEKWQKQYFCSGFKDEKGYLSELHKFPVSKWLEKLIQIYWIEFYDIYLLTARHKSYKAKTEQWLKERTNIASNIRKLILKPDEKMNNNEFKLEEVKKISKCNDIEIIFDDNPEIVKTLQNEGFNAVLVKSLY